MSDLKDITIKNDLKRMSKKKHRRKEFSKK